MTRRSQIGIAALALLLAAATLHAGAGTIPAGATITVRMVESMDTKTSHPGDTFHATVDAPLSIDGQVVIPRGAEAIGRLVEVQQSGRFRGRSLMAVELTALNFEGRSVAIRTSTHRESGASRDKQTAIFSGGGAVAGTIIGTIAGGPLLGAGLGAASGAVYQAVRGSEQVQIPAESLLIFTLQAPITVDLGF